MFGPVWKIDDGARIFIQKGEVLRGAPEATSRT